MYFLLGISIVLAAMLVVNGFASLVAELVWKTLSTRAQQWSAASRASILYLLRILPVALSITCVGLLFGPAYLTHEPRTNHEDVSVKLGALALFSAIGLGLALVRAVAACRATSRLTKNWLQNAEPISLPQIGVPAFRMKHRFPVIAVVGTFRPRLFVADQIFQSLTSEELSAAIEHEAGHLLARDNLKRGLMRACRDMLLIIPCGRPLDRAWKEAAEAAADEYAARRNQGVGVELASALVKIARLIPLGASPNLPAGAFLVGDEYTTGFRTRVRRLLQLAGNDQNLKSPAALISRFPIWLPLGVVLLLIAIKSIDADVLVMTHLLIERAVHFLG